VDSVREWWAELREHWDDYYWHADHPEVRAVLVALIVGLVGLVFAWFEALIFTRYKGAH